MGVLASAKAMTFIVTRDRERSTVFYGATLGFKLLHEDDFAAVFDLNGTMLRVSTVADHVAQPHTVLGWEVPDIAEAVTALREKGVSFSIYDGFGQDALGVWTAPGSGSKVAWFTDPDGNVLSLAQL
jgi:catechol 2,3-dioxygenase-like lactoylglutathione lyase family enzyme